LRGDVETASVIAVDRTLVLALLVFVVSLAALAMLRGGVREPALTAARAERAALDSQEVRQALAGGFTRIRTMPLDERTVRVSFFDGPRAVAGAAVGSDGRVQAVVSHDGLRAQVGSDVGQQPPVLAGLIALFLIATLRVPLMRRENLDALALAAVTAPIVLLNERYAEWSVLAAVALFVYLGWRCVGVAVGRSVTGPWLMDRLPRRVTAMLAGGVAAALVLLSIPGGLVSDVGYASMAGATQILEGHLPYGNVTSDGLVHGDTYPLVAYLAYVPAALVGPVHGAFDNLDGSLWVATAFALATSLALGRTGGARTAIAFLAFPPVMVAASSGSNDVVAAAFVAAALLLGPRAGTSSGALAAAAAVKLAPLAVLPMWVAGRRRPAALAAGALAAVVAVAVLLLGGVGGFGDIARALAFQVERGSPMSVWALVDLPAARITFQAAVVTGIALAAVAVWRDRALAADPRRMAALGAAVLLAVQLAANHWAPTYLAWVFPLVAVALLTPSRPPAPASSPPAGRR
jgi:Glycosyltransferase family 87